MTMLQHAVMDGDVLLSQPCDGSSERRMLD